MGSERVATRKKQLNLGLLLAAFFAAIFLTPVFAISPQGKEYLRKAKVFFVDGDLRMARDYLQRAIKLDPNDPDIAAMSVDLQKKMGLTYLFVAHDLSMVKHISDRVAVLYLGTLVELTTSEELYANPRHPYTQALLSAIPIPDPKVEAERDRKKIRLEGEVPSPINTKPGCKFQGRCKYAKDICRQQMPELKDVGNNHFVACHFCDALEENKEL